MKALLWTVLNALQWLGVALWTALWTSLAIVAVALTRRPHVGLVLARRVWSPVILGIGGVRFELRGGEHVAGGGPFFLACNHQSFIDIPLLFRALPVDLRFVAKRELRNVPFLGWYMAAMGMVFVDRYRLRSGAAGVDAASALLRAGATVLSFPSGTRRRPDEPQGWKAAAFAPAISAQAPVVPVAILGTAGLLSRGARLRPGHAVLWIGEPIPTVGLALDAREEIARRAERAVTEMLAALAINAGEGSVVAASAALDAGRASLPL
jgi:1-acyl-sn-glycerol-3-phosphate acyltransferase